MRNCNENTNRCEFLPYSDDIDGVICVRLRSEASRGAASAFNSKLL
jgi:hypothetical protein